MIAHELAHQWFGNLVTMEWWDDLWLNEGFASYTEYIGTNAVEPTWQMAFLQMYAYEYLDAMDLDALASTHPIEANVTDPAVVSQLFDSISYGKGASVIRMLQNYVDVKGGAGYFIQRINQYLSDEAYTNAVTSDLWAAMTSNVIPEVPDMMNSWTGQPGFPLLIVTQSGSTFSVSQERFLAIPAQWTPEMGAVFFTFSSSSSSSFLCNCVLQSYHVFVLLQQLWQIPVLFSTSVNIAANTAPSTLLMTTPTLSPFPLTLAPGAWYKLNLGQTVPLRVQYPSSNLQLIKQSLLQNVSCLAPIDRAGLLDDAWNLANAEVIEASDALTLSQYLTVENSNDLISSFFTFFLSPYFFFFFLTKTPLFGVLR